MSEWQEVKIKDVLDKVIDNRGKTPPIVKNRTEYELLEVNSIVNVTRTPKYEAVSKFVDKQTYETWFRAGHPKAGDIVVATVGSIGALAVLDANRGSIAQNLIALRPDKGKINSNFLYYLLRSPLVNQRMLSLDISSVQPSIKVPHLLGLTISIPTRLDLQAEIAGVFECIDKKIELNQRMNETLEAMARALLKSWFVDFDPVRVKVVGRKPEGMDAATAALFPAAFNDDGLPEGWAWGTLGKIVDSVGATVQPNQTSPDTPYIGLEHMPRRCIALSEWEGAGKVTSNKFAFTRGDFLFGKLRPYFHKVGIAAIDGISSTDILVVRPKREEFYAFVLSVISSNEFVGYTDKTSQGTKMPRTNWKDMARYELVLPDKDVALAYNSAVKPMLEQIIANVHESRTLSALRDALLPKLISGELLIEEAKRKQGK